MFFVKGWGGKAIIELAILVLTEVIRKGFWRPKITWKKVWTIFTKICLTLYSIFSLCSDYVHGINKQKML